MQLSRLLAIWSRLRPTRRRSTPRRVRAARRGSPGTLALALAAASCALLGGGGDASLAGEGADRWSFDTAILYYDEGDRVQDASLNLLARRLFARGRALSVRFGIDSLTGASASGAAPALDPQTFTSPSGNGSYTTPGAATPLDSTFLDTRVAVSATWTQPLGHRSTGDFGVSLSNEYDYLHTGLNARFSRDFNERNTTLIAGVAFAADSLDPVGGVPLPLTQMLPEGDLSAARGADSESKTVVDLLLGVNQVLGTRTVGQLNYSFSTSSGYLSDPYKILSVVDPTTGDPVAGPGSLFLYRHEARPDTRAKHSLFAQIKHQLRRDILDVGYRFMTDDWGIESHTLDMRYRWRMERFYLQPHLRYYSQTAADFYRTVLFDGAALPEFATADYRLGEFDATTLGLKVGLPRGDDREWSMRVEFYRQSGTASAEASVGSLSGLELYPDLDAVIVQGGYRF